MADADPAAAAAPKASDLPVRLASALVMILVAGAALYLDGLVWLVFVLAIGVGVLWEYNRLVTAFARGGTLWAWRLFGAFYIGLGALRLAALRGEPLGGLLVLAILVMVIGTDVGAYFAGRTIGGPKIAPRISPKKTWAGLGGGILVAGLALYALFAAIDGLAVASDSWLGQLLNTPGRGFQFVFGMTASPVNVVYALVAGGVVAVVAQAGDFFESWLKRRAGVKDSSALIPGHGGLFDRVDGLIAVMAVFGLVSLVAKAMMPGLG